MGYSYKKVVEILFEILYKKYITQLINNDFKPNGYSFFINTTEIDNAMGMYQNYSLQIEKEYNNSHFFDGTELLPYTIIKYYTGYFHEKINNNLRGILPNNQKSLIINKILKHTEILKKEIEKFPLKSNFVVTRRISNTFLKEVYLERKQLKKNGVIQELAFLSTSLDLFYRKDYESNYSPLKNETIIIIKVPKGINALYLEPISNREEFELLLDSGLKMKIEDKKTIFGNNIILTQIIK
ncbi:ADP-ribosyltransferase [Flavobacterium sediminis]|nr:ADP-ribosyltransferase [Flavobacterium sediminis]